MIGLKGGEAKIVKVFETIAEVEGRLAVMLGDRYRVVRIAPGASPRILPIRSWRLVRIAGRAEG
jgi:hypothetical protein